MEDTQPSQPPGGQSIEKDGDIFFYLDSDLIRYDWDVKFGSWFPSSDQSLFDRSISYSGSCAAPSQARKVNRQPRQQQQQQQQQQQRKNTSVYASGLPVDASVEEIRAFFGKCGVIMDSLLTPGEPRIKIYKDSLGRAKGDALITYLMEESVQMAIELLDGTEFKGKKVGVAAASFNESEAKSATEVKKKKLKQAFGQMKRKLAWEDLDQPEAASSTPRVILLRRMYDPQELLSDPETAFDIKTEVSEECSNLFGPVSNVRIYENENDGVMTVKFKNAADARKAIEGLNGRWYDGRVISASFYDGSLRLFPSEPAKEA